MDFSSLSKMTDAVLDIMEDEIGEIDENIDSIKINLYATLFNHIGNAKQLITSIEHPINAIEREKMIKQSQVQLDNVVNDLSNLRHLDLLSTSGYMRISDKIKELETQLMANSDSDYS